MPDDNELSGIGRTSGARNELVAGLMKEAVENNECPFCSPYFEEKNGEWAIVFDDDFVPRYWKVWHNPSPLPGTSFHIMLAPNSHLLSTADLSKKALYERDCIVEVLQQKFRYESFTEFSRQGKPDYNSATVYHLHYHIVVSSGEPASEVVIPGRYLQLIDAIIPEIEAIAFERDQDPLETMDKLRGYIDVYREARRGKAVPIRVKFSNKVGANQLKPST